MNNLGSELKRKLIELYGYCKCIYNKIIKKKENKKCYYHLFINFLIKNKVIISGDWLMNKILKTDFSDSITFIYKKGNKFDERLGFPFDIEINLSMCFAFKCAVHGGYLKTFKTRTINEKIINWIIVENDPIEFIKNKYNCSINHIAYKFETQELWCPKLSKLKKKRIKFYKTDYSKCKDENKKKLTEETNNVRINIYKKLGFYTKK